MKLTAMLAAAGVSMLLAIAGCSTLKNIASGTVTVPTSKIVAAASGVDTAEQLAGTYIQYCSPATQPAGCSNAAIVQIVPAVRSVRAARNAAEQWIVDNPSATVGPESLVDAITNANNALATIEAQYSVASVVK